MPPAICHIAALPVELLHLICTAADPRDLYSIALSNRRLNAVATPVLYSSINPQRAHAIYACVRTLASPPRKAAMSRDLASFVENLELRDPDEWICMSLLKDSHRFIMGRRLADAVPRMRRLRSITCRIGAGIPHTLSIFTTLARGVLPFVKAIDMEISFSSLYDATWDAAVDAAPVVVGATDLQTLKLDWFPEYDPPQSYVMLMCSLLAANHTTLQSLAVCDSDVVLDAAWRSVPSFPLLKELEIAPDLLTKPAFADTSSIRRLSVPDEYLWDDFELSPTALPNLQEIACFPGHLQLFLPESAEHRRPISAVFFNHVRYERTRSGGHYCMEDWDVTYDWMYIWNTLHHVRFSGSPLRRLGFAVCELSVVGLSTLLPLVKDLEYLLIVMQETEEKLRERNGKDDICSLAEVLSRMPRLHTLLISDGYLKTLPDGGPFEFAHDEDYQRRALAAYDVHSSSLRRVAFTTDFEWEKREDAWHPWGHVAAEREVDSDGEHEDEELSES